jgi:hypothetical protein
MSASVIYGYDSFKSGTSLTDCQLGRWSGNNGGISPLSLNATNGRFGGQCLRIVNGFGPAYLFRTLSALPTMTLHIPVRVNTLPSGAIGIFGFRDGATQQVTLRLNADGTLSLCRGGSGGTVLATSTYTLNAAYRVLELKVVFSTTVGTYELRADSVPIIGPTTSANTSASTAAQATQYWLGIDGTVSTLQVDVEHVICLDDFIGDKRFYARAPSSNLAAVWTPNASTNLSRVQEAQEDGDTSTISSSNPGDQDWYGYPALPAGVRNIFAVIHSAWWKKSDAGARQTRMNWKQGSTLANGAIVNPSTTYSEQLDISYVDPVSGIAFLKSDVDSLANGPELHA